MPRISQHAGKRPEAERLRRDLRLGTKEIARRLALPISTAHHWLRTDPLSTAERGAIISASPRYVAPKKTLAAGEGFPCDVAGAMQTIAMGSLGESAIQYRLHLRNLKVARPVGDGDVVDIYVRKPGGQRMAFVQVRVASEPPARSGLPSISLRRHRNGKTQLFQPGDFHFLVGFCLRDQSAYVYSYEEVSHLRNSVTVRPDAKEAWHKIERWLDGVDESPSRAKSRSRRRQPARSGATTEASA